MSEFTSYFLDHDLVTNPALSSYTDFFVNYKPSKWDRGCGDGIFSFVSDSGDKSELSVIENENFGISVRYNFRKSGERKSSEFYSVGSPEKISQIENVGEDHLVPVGSFLKPAEAWIAVEDFFDNPTQKSGRIEWIDSEDIPWPENW